MKSRIITLGFCLASLCSMGQQYDIQAADDKQRTIARSEKLTQFPLIKDSVMEIRPVKYYLEPANHKVSFEVDPIKPAKLKVVEPLQKLYSGYVKGGVGNYTMPYLDFYYGSQRSRKNAWGIMGNHHSALGGIDEIGDSRFSDNSIGGYYKHFLKNHSLEFNTDYARNHYNLYGFRTDDTLYIPEAYLTNLDTIDQTFHRVNFGTSLASMFKDSSKINHEVNLNYHMLVGAKQINEHNVVVDGNLFKYAKKEEFGGDFELDLNALNQPSLAVMGCDSCGDSIRSNQLSTIVGLSPFIHTRSEKWEAKAGISIYTLFTDVATVKFYPNLEANYKLFDNIFVPYVGMNGGMRRNTFNSLSLENPFLVENSEIRTTNEKLNLYLGVRGTFSSKLSFNLSVAQQKLEDAPFFYSDTLYSYQNGFGLVYDNLTTQSVKAQVGYANGEKLKIGFTGEYFSYSTATQEHAWNMPDFKIALNGVYDLADKIIARMDLFVVGERNVYSYREVEGVTPTSDGRYIFALPAFIDANLGFEYRYNEKLSAFINFNNLASKKYQRWSNYPVQGFNLLGGVTFSF